MLSTVLSKCSVNSPVIITVAMSGLLLFLSPPPLVPCQMPGTVGSQSLPAKHVAECRVVILTSLVSPPTASFICNSFSLICLFFFFSLPLCSKLEPLNDFCAITPHPQQPDLGGLGDECQEILVGNVFWEVENGPPYRDAIVQVTRP